MKSRILPVLTGLFLLVGTTLMAQPGGSPTTNPNPAPAPAGLPANSATTKILNCPTGPDCEGDCIFTVTISSQAGAKCEDNRVDVNLQANSTGKKCVADYERSSEGGIEFTICGGEKCKLDENTFPDNSFWPPYIEGDGRPKKAGKDSLSKACADAIGLTTDPPLGPGAGPPFQRITYRFKGVSSVNPDFGMKTDCKCNNKVVRDTIVVQVTEVDAEVIEDGGRPGDDTKPGEGGRGGGSTDTGSGKQHSGNFADAETFSVSNIYPNPATDELNVVFQTRESAYLQVFVHDQVGQQVWQSLELIQEGDNLFTLDVRELKGGFYFMTVIAPDGEKVVMKFIHK